MNTLHALIKAKMEDGMVAEVGWMMAAGTSVEVTVRSAVEAGIPAETPTISQQRNLAK